MNNSVYSFEEAKLLLKTALNAIQYGINQHKIMPIDLASYPKSLQQKRACFVTLTIDHELRGCIGSLNAHQPLIQDVVDNAYSAAFRDPRFYPVSAQEIKKLRIAISILSKPEPLLFNSEADLLNKIRPGIDGLILSDRGYQGTFLPSVWEELPTKEEFLAHLKLKAGLPENYWSDTLKIQRYTAEKIGEE